MNKRKEIRLTGWVGLSMPVISLLPIPLTGTLAKPFPCWSDSTEEIRRGASENQAFGWFQLLLSTISLALVLWFTAGLCEYLATSGQCSLFPNLTIMSAVAGIVCYNIANATWMVLLLSNKPHHFAIQSLLAAFAANKTIVDESSTRTALTEVTTE